MFQSVIHGVFCTAFLSVEYGYDAMAVIDHPFVSDLIAASAVKLTHHNGVVSIFKDVVIFFLPVGTPPLFKIGVRT